MRVLIATVTAGAGHLQAAAALEEAWLSLRPDDVVKRVDLLDYVPKLRRKVYAEGYIKLVQHAPELWGMIFNKTDNPKLVRKTLQLRRNYAQATNRKYIKFLQSFAPDVVLCTHYLPVQVTGALKSENVGQPPLTACVVTDFEAHSLWMDECVDLYCVAAGQTRDSLVARGASPARVTVTGIPIGSQFRSPPDAAVIRRRLGFRDDLPTLLVLGGGFGMGPVAEILGALDQVKPEFQTVVVAGRNQELRRELASQDRAHPTHVLGFVANMHELMTVADVIVSKPGGLTTSEALALGKPLFILNPIPGQETANSDFLLTHGAAVKAGRVEEVAFRIEQLLGSKKLADMGKAARALGKPDAAKEICTAVVQLAAGRSAPVLEEANP